MEPKEISEFSDTAFMITWDDRHESIYLYEDLRQSCPCTRYNDIRKSGKGGKLPFKRAIPIGVQSRKIRPEKTELVGLYAIRFKWNDGHDTGIHSFEFLRKLCPCEK
ncbi:MAG: hypothetical protein C4291_05625, partial [Candidatus Dadabacteria bacterium]